MELRNILLLGIAILLSSCGRNNVSSSSSSSAQFTSSSSSRVSSSSNSVSSSSSTSSSSISSSSTYISDSSSTISSSIYTIYFSVTNNTRGIANSIYKYTNSNIYEIIPADPYTSEDINYSNSNSRANREQNDASARPSIGSESIDLSNTDIIFLGYPIWWGKAPKIIYTFLDMYDLSGKTVVPFCTSGSSSISGSESDLHNLEPGANWLPGKRFSSSASINEIGSWIESLDLSISNTEDENMIYAKINNSKLEIELVDNSSTKALVDILRQNDITYMAHDYGNFEKVGDIGYSLPQNNTDITTEPGDVILYQGKSICFYYDTNTWSFTRIGKIKNATKDDLVEILQVNNGEIEVTLSLN